MQYTLIGDVHGKPMQLTPDFLEPYSIQVGDLDIEFRYQWAAGFKEPRFFIDGNHDHFPSLDLSQKSPYPVCGNLWHIPRGFFAGNVLFIGGGVSIDQAERVEGVDWFRDEEPSYMVFRRIMYDPELEGKVDVVISHEAPYSFVRNTLQLRAWSAFYHSNTGSLQEIFEFFKPSLWIFGHYHRSIDVEYEGCRFVCLDINEKREFDLPVDLPSLVAK